MRECSHSCMHNECLRYMSMYDRIHWNTPVSLRFGIKSFGAHPPTPWGFLSLHLLLLQQRTMPHGYCTIWDDRALLIMFYYVVAGMRFLLGTTTRQRAQRSYRCFDLNCGPFVQQALHSLCFWSPDIKMKGGHAIATNRDRHDCRAQHISA